MVERALKCCLEFLGLGLLLAGCAGGNVPPSPGTPSPAATALPTPWPTATPTSTPFPGALYVDPGNDLGPISPLVYGTNYGPWQNLSEGALSYVEQAGLTLLRFPGGNWGDEYLLTEQRFDQFVALARRLGAEPMVNVRLFRATPQDAARWVQYANVTRGYGIRYWGIGNEPSLYATQRGLEGYDTVAFNRQWREFALAMKAVDPTIQLFGPETHQFTGKPGDDPRDLHGKDWMREFLAANCDLLDIVSIHRYPFGLSRAQISDLRRNSREWDDIIPRLRTLVRQMCGRDLPIAVTEVNSSWAAHQGGTGTPDSFYNAIWWADVLGRMLVQRVDIVAHFCLEGGAGAGLLSGSRVRPTYYVYLLYRHFGQRLVYASSDDPQLSIYAARRDDGALTIVLVNLGAQAKTKVLRMEQGSWAAIEAWLLDEEHPAVQVDVQAVWDGREVVLPAASVTLLVWR